MPSNVACEGKRSKLQKEAADYNGHLQWPRTGEEAKQISEQQLRWLLEGMTKVKGHSYVTEKLNGAGCTQTVFENSALESLLNAATGSPRIINKLCNASLLIGNNSNLNIIITYAVMQAINDCELG